MNFIIQLLENLKIEKFIHVLETILDDVKSRSISNKGNKYLLGAIDLFSKYAWVISIKNKKGVSLVNTFQRIISEGRKPNEMWVDQGREFCNNSFKDFLKINNIEMYATYNEGKSVVAEIFIRTLKNKISKHMTAISANVYFDMLDDIVNKYNNTVHKTIKMNPIDIIDDSYAEYKEDFKFLNLKLAIMLEFQNIKTFLRKNILEIGWKKFLLLVKLKIKFLQHMLLMI